MADQHSPIRLQLHDPCLFGRSKELDTLAHACERSRNSILLGADHGPQIVLVAGESGAGKSSLVEEALRREEKLNPNDFVAGECKTYICSGKFSQVQGYEPYAALKQAFSELCDSILNTRERGKMCDDLSDVLGPEGRILVDVVPGVATLMIADQQDDVVSNTQGSMESFLRLKFLLKLFVRTVCKHRRFILFLDDMQWSDRSTLELVESIISDSETHQFMFIGTYRIDEVDQKHPFSEIISKVERYRSIQRIEVGNMNVESIDELVRYLTRGDREKTRDVAELVYRKTLGNPFMVREFLRLMETEKFIEYSWMNLEWTFRLDKMIKETHLPDSVVGVVALKISRLPQEGQDILKLAACLWSRFHAGSLFLIATRLDKGFSRLETEGDSGHGCYRKSARQSRERTLQVLPRQNSGKCMFTLQG